MGRDKDKKPPSGGRGIGGLADALLKAGVVDTKTVNRGNQDRRNEEKTLSPEELAQRAAERSGALAAKRAAEDEASRARLAELDDAGRGERLRLAITANRDTARGSKRWFFVARDGRIPFLEVSDTAYRQLTDGDAGITESMGTVPDEHVVIAGRQALVTIDGIEPELIRFWNKTRRS